jgi:uncharacterized YigZ family protein
MQEQQFYYTIQQNSEAVFTDKGSKFIAYAYPLQNANAVKLLLQNLKKLHPKAVHYCYAYRLGSDGLQFKQSDDGEPSGTAGKPILNQIISKELTNILVVVVRYFGGTLLGVPGLINAYKTATQLVLQTVPIVQKAIEVKFLLEFDYTLQNDVLTIIKQYNCTIVQHEQQLFNLIELLVPLNRLQEVHYKFSNLYGLSFKKIN